MYAYCNVFPPQTFIAILLQTKGRKTVVFEIMSQMHPVELKLYSTQNTRLNMTKKIIWVL